MRFRDDDDRGPSRDWHALRWLQASSLVGSHRAGIECAALFSSAADARMGHGAHRRRSPDHRSERAMGPSALRAVSDVNRQLETHLRALAIVYESATESSVNGDRYPGAD